MGSTWQRLGEEIDRFRSEIRELPVVASTDVATLRRYLERSYSFETPVALESVVLDAVRLLREGSVHVTHPRYFGLFNPSVLEGGILGDALVAAFNPQLAVWSHAPAAQEIERHVLREFARILGLNPDGMLANFTSGGAEANLSAVLAALAFHFPEVGEAGLRSLSMRPAIYMTEHSHHSFVKIAQMAGLGTTSLREVSTTAELKMDPEALRNQIVEDMDAGWKPVLVVATAGTTGAGTIDDLGAISAVAREFNAWYHVDAAWGAAAALSPRLRPFLRGIETADSITWDAHKWLSVPMGAGMFFCRHPEALHRAFSVGTSYMPGVSGRETVDPYLTTSQWSRRAIGMKVFLSFAQLGHSGYEEVIERQARMGDYLRRRLVEHGWEVINRTVLPVICFTHPAIRSKDLSTTEVLQFLYERGKVWISDVVLDSELALRACVTSYRTDTEDIDVLVEELDRSLIETGVSR